MWRSRPSASARGYDAARRKARRQLARNLPQYCGYRCGTMLTADGDWVAVPVVEGDPTSGWLLSCRSCSEHEAER